ncbi:MAG: gamma carbonic anhydrase family protein [Candidatus Altiarchaeales archaeon]|nr:gamma carbonic anhydrase family protein [Candidatus Altiarchaeales archaeon]
MIDETVFIAEGARVVGEVSIAEYSSVWFNAVVRGDRSKILIGRYSNVQDCCVIHSPREFPVRIGDFCTIGHGSKVHGAEVGGNSLIGMGAILMNGANVGEKCVVAASSVVTESIRIPNGSLVSGSPAKVVRRLSEKEIESIKQNALEYKDLASMQKAGGD